MRRNDTHICSEPLWAEIDLGAIAANVHALRRIISPDTRLMVAVKADGYGHGALQVARTAIASGASDLGVARIEEGLALRRRGIAAPILIFGYTCASKTSALIANDLMPSIFSLKNAREFSEAAQQSGRVLPVHVKVDTGMGRLGLLCDALRKSGEGPAAHEIAQIYKLPGLTVKGLFTHFATADHADTTYAQTQLDRFLALCTELKAAGLGIGLRHAANSGAIIQIPRAHMEMVRAGIAVYGLYPSDEMDCSNLSLQPAMMLKARIIHLKEVAAGTSISYGCSYKTPRSTTIATIPAGYADGYSRALSNKGVMLVGGYRVPVVGRVCMDLTMVDVGRVPGVKIGDEAVLIGRQHNETISADALARTMGTINYEVVASLTARVPRIYR
jgi:alanine racemase